LNANAANAFIGVTQGNGVIWQVRSSDGGGTTSSTTNGLSVWCESYWVKLAQSGATLTGYYSVDGVNWTQLGSATIAGMGAANCGGLVFCNHDNSSSGTATFAGVALTGCVLMPSVPTGVTATAGMEQVSLNWQTASNAAGYNIGRSTVSGGPYTTAASVTTTNYTDLNLAGRTTYYYVVTAVTPGSQGTNSAQVSATPTANVPPPWAALDIGILPVAGSESFSNGVFAATASGSDYDASYTYTANPFDDFRFVYATNTSGNCTILTRVASLRGGNQWSKAGVTIRDSLNANAANAFIGMTPSNGVVFEHRSTDGITGSFGNNVTNLAVPCWVSLVQSGSAFAGYYSADGNNWTQLGTATVSMGRTEYVGMAVCANNNGTGYANNPVTTTFTATFDNVSAPGWPSFAGPTNLTATAASGGQVNLTWNPLTNATSYNVKRSTTSGGPYTTIASGVTTTNYTDFAAFNIVACYYVVSAMVGGSETANSAEVALLHPELIGMIIGTPGSWNNSGNTISNVFDNNLNTYFDAPDPGNGDWVGLYFGASVSNAITQINYCPRSGEESRMVGGIFQGANQTNFSDAVALYTVTTQPPSGVFTSVSITNTSAFRCVRYLSPNGGYGNVAELQFYGYLAGASVPLPPAPGGLAATAVSSGQINLTWNVVTNAASYNVKRSTTNGGPYAVIATGVTTTNYNDTGLAAATTYFYVVSGVNLGGEGTNSIQISATTMPAAPAGLTAAAVSANQISLTWNAVNQATSYYVKRSAISGGSYTTIAIGVTATNYTDTVPAGMKYYYVVSAVCSGQEGPNSLEATVNLPYPWVSQDVGAVGMAGSAIYSNGVFTVAGGGPEIDMSTGDAFRFVYVPVTGACTIVARVVSLENGSGFAWTKVGVMIRASLAANAANAFMGVSLGSGAIWQYRVSTAGGTSYSTSTGTAPYWVKLVWNGSAGTCTGYSSPDGVNWTQVGTQSISIGATGYVGLAVTSPYNNYLTTATFDYVTTTGWPLLPGAPGSLTATAGNARVTLIWPAVSGASSYNLKRSLTNGGPYALVSNVTTTNYTDAGLANGTTYYYVVSALNPAGESTNSAQASVNPQAPPPLNILVTGANLTVCWPSNSAGFMLQMRTNLVLGNWLNVTSPAPQNTNGQWQVMLPLSPDEPSVFYHLLK
jgi:fibronectin type 3 domain-containing protein